MASDDTYIPKAQRILAAVDVYVDRPTEATRRALLDAIHAELVGTEIPDRGALYWNLWHHQGGSSEIGQRIRRILGMTPHQRMTEDQIREGKAWAARNGAWPAANPQARARDEQATGPRS